MVLLVRALREFHSFICWERAAWIKARGGTILVESEETCVVYGMPRSVVEAGLADAIVPLDRMAEAIVERL